MTTTAPSFSSITPRQIRVIGVPLDLGQSRRGVDMGPSAVRVAGLEARLEAIGHVVEDGVEFGVVVAEEELGSLSEWRQVTKLASVPGGDIADRPPLPLARCRKSVGRRS